jgi:hypothetical protein
MVAKFNIWKEKNRGATKFFSLLQGGLEIIDLRGEILFFATELIRPTPLASWVFGFVFYWIEERVENIGWCLNQRERYRDFWFCFCLNRDDSFN